MVSADGFLARSVLEVALQHLGHVVPADEPVEGGTPSSLVLALEEGGGFGHLERSADLLHGVHFQQFGGTDLAVDRDDLDRRKRGARHGVQGHDLLVGGRGLISLSFIVSI